jgi:hypothetical protein
MLVSSGFFWNCWLIANLSPGFDKFSKDSALKFIDVRARVEINHKSTKIHCHFFHQKLHTYFNI